MKALVNLSLFGWIPFVMILFMVLPPRRAVVASFIIAWLFLPMYSFNLPGLLPDYDKVSATCLGIFLATAIFDAGRFMTFRPKWYDLPMALWCCVSLPSAMHNGLGIYEGLSGIMYQTITWGVPYLIGRIYFNSLEGLRELALGVIIGGIVYVPLCLYEIRMSPQLHTMVYGFHQHDFSQAKRGGGWRPTVFMQHGLAVATFMCTATLMAAWVAISDGRRRIMGMPLTVFALGLFATAVLCKSSGATLLMLGGLATLAFVRTTKLSFPIWGLLALPFAYMLVRTVGGWDASQIKEFAGMVSARAEDSIRFRLNAETNLWNDLGSRKLLGATRFYWASVNPEEGLRIVPDGLWVVALGRFGIVGVLACFACFATPVAIFLTRFRISQWANPLVAVGAVWGMCLALWSIDCLSNAMVNPLFLLAAGGLGAVPALLPQFTRRTTPTPHAQPSGSTSVVRLTSRYPTQPSSEPLLGTARQHHKP